MTDFGNNSEFCHLRRFGYAPGSYLKTCGTCSKPTTCMDKSATTCRSCAEEKSKQVDLMDLLRPPPTATHCFITRANDYAGGGCLKLFVTFYRFRDGCWEQFRTDNANEYPDWWKVTEMSRLIKL